MIRVPVRVDATPDEDEAGWWRFRELGTTRPQSYDLPTFLVPPIFGVGDYLVLRRAGDERCGMWVVDFERTLDYISGPGGRL